MSEKVKKKRIPSRILSVLSGLVIGAAGYLLYRNVTGQEILSIFDIDKYLTWFKYGLIGVTAFMALLGLLNVPVGFKIVKILLCLALAGAMYYGSDRVSHYGSRISSLISPIPDKGKTEFSIYVPADSNSVDPAVLGMMQNYNLDSLQDEAIKQLNDGGDQLVGYSLGYTILNDIGNRLGGAILDWRYVQAIYDIPRMHGQFVDPATKQVKDCDFETEFRKLKSVVLDIDNCNSLQPYTGDLKDRPIVIGLSITDKWNYSEAGADGFTSRTYDNKAIIINPVSRQVLIVTVPRDGLVLATINGNSGREIMTNTSLYGLDVWADALSTFMGCPIDYVFRVEMTDLIPLIDSLGGITVVNPAGFPSRTIKVMRDGELKPVEMVFSSGKITLTGEEAYVYMKETEELVNGEDGRDVHLIAAVQGLINTIAQKDWKELLKNRDVLLDNLEGLFTGNMDLVKIISYVKNEILPGEGEWDMMKYSFNGYASRDEILSYYGQFADGLRIYYALEDRFRGTVQRILHGEPMVD